MSNGANSALAVRVKNLEDDMKDLRERFRSVERAVWMASGAVVVIMAALKFIR